MPTLECNEISKELIETLNILVMNFNNRCRTWYRSLSRTSKTVVLRDVFVPEDLCYYLYYSVHEVHESV
jgi:hypothetical protein